MNAQVPSTRDDALSSIETPALLLDLDKLRANVARMNGRMAALGVQLRAHVKTAKCLPVAALADGGRHAPITVSTLREADHFAAGGWRDITYAVGLTPNKFAHVRRLLEAGVALGVIVDSVEAARAVAEAFGSAPAARPLAVHIEIDVDDQRAGIKPEAPALLDIAAVLAAADPRGLRLAGVLTHGGGSYHCHGPEALAAMAEQERAGAVHAAARLRAAGHAAPVVSVGSTPTALFAPALPGVTEVRAGVYVFMDLMMAALGVCAPQDIAASVLTSVVGRRADKGWTLVDAGWMALSRDRGLAADGFTDQGLGLVCDAAGQVMDDFVVVGANQEHGLIAHRSGDPALALDLPVGSLLRILPNHACATAAQHEGYHLLGEAPGGARWWPRFGGW